MQTLLVLRRIVYSHSRLTSGTLASVLVMPEAVLRFGQFALDVGRLELRAADEVRPLGQKAFETLRYLIDHRERVVARDELLDAIWPDTMVSDGSLSTAIKEIRRALGERSGGESAIRTVPRRGYRFVIDLELDGAPTEPASPPGTDLPRAATPSDRPDAPIAGRADELRILETFVEGILHREGALVVLAGPAGAGKTMLARRASNLATARGIEVLRARCDSVPGAPALWPIIQVLRVLAARQSDANIEAVGGRTELAALLRALGGPNAIGDIDDDPASARFKLLDAVSRTLLGAGRSAPLLLWFEDLHSADASSLELLSFLGQQLEGTSVGIIATCRQDAEGGITVPRGAQLVDLGRLSDADVAALIDIAAGAPMGARSRDSIVEAADGNPQLACLLVQSVIEATPPGASEPGPGWQRHIARSLRDVVVKRFGSLSAECQRTLHAAACAGEEFGGARLARLLEINEERLGGDLHEAAIQGLVIVGTRVSSRHRFAHGLYRDVVYASQPRASRVEWHSLIAAQIERETGGVSQVAGELVHHYGASNAGSSAARFLRHGVAAAVEIGAHDTAAQLLGSVEDRSLLSSLDGPGRAEMLLRAAVSREAIGASSEELQTIYRRAFRLGQKARSAELTARAALGFAGCRSYRGVGVGAGAATSAELDLLGGALELQPDNSVWHALVEARLGVLLQGTDDSLRGQGLTRAATVRAEALGDPRTLCEALVLRARALSGPDDGARCVEVAQEARVMAQQAGFSALESDARFEGEVARLRGGSMTAAELDELAGVQALGGDSDPRRALRRACWGILRAHAMADVGEMKRRIPEATALAAHAAPIAVPRLLRTYDWELERLRTGNPSKGPALSIAEAALFKAAAWMGFAGLAVQLDEGHLRSARILHRAIAPRLGKLARNAHFLPAAAVAVWGAHVFDDPRRAHAAYDVLLPYAGQMVTVADGLIVQGPVHHYLGIAALTTGELDAAQEHFEAANAEQRRLGALLSELVTRKYQALLRLARGDVDGCREAVGHLRLELKARGLGGPLRDLEADLERRAPAAAQ